ncbi:MAG: ribosome biogenesis GTPase YlqF [Clostridia bacterium]|nr:ribosome biogenesis GTPase YlqF [Clostridia bacterium]
MNVTSSARWFFALRRCRPSARSSIQPGRQNGLPPHPAGTPAGSCASKGGGFVDREAPYIQWFPGHMTKTRRMIESDLKLVDAVVELLDARTPKSSQNPLIEELTKGKKRLVVLNKSDLADPAANRLWMAHFKAQRAEVVELNAVTGKGVPSLAPALRRLLKEKIERDQARGMNKPLRAMVLGIPNVGKSSLINRLAKASKVKVADRPGVTRGKQWIRMEGNIDLLDTPGILWPKFEDSEVSLHLAFTGAIKDDVMDVEEIACLLLERLSRLNPSALTARYKLEPDPEQPGYELLTKLGRNRGFLISGGEIDTERAARILLDEFRGGKLGQVTLELPPREVTP